jgi:ferric-dicitrate binding protein FerR (iron transport regulator)
MIRILSFLTALAVLPLFAASQASAEDVWTVVQSVGVVRVEAAGALPVAIKPSQPLPLGATIVTGASGRVILLKGRESIVVSPQSRVTLPAKTGATYNKVLQQSGTLFFKVGKQARAHFQVDTPYLSAVVKGTTFSVSVRQSSAAVHVHEGAVEVLTRDKRKSVLTEAGQISRVLAAALSEILTTGVMEIEPETGGVWQEPTPEFDMPDLSDPAWASRQDGWSLRPSNATNLVTASSGTGDAAVATSGGAVIFDPFAALASALAAKDGDSAKDEPQGSTDTAAALVRRAARTLASPDAWIVVSSSGDIEIDSEQISRVKKSNGFKVGGGAKIRTGQGAHLVLTNGRETIAAGGLAELQLPNLTKGGNSQIKQTSGKVTYRFNRAQSEEVSIETPWVKTTAQNATISIDLEADQKSVSVERGEARLSSANGSQSLRLSAGGKAWTNKDNAGVLEFNGGPTSSHSGTSVQTPALQTQASASHSRLIGSKPAAKSFALGRSAAAQANGGAAQSKTSEDGFTQSTLDQGNAFEAALSARTGRGPARDQSLISDENKNTKSPKGLHSSAQNSDAIDIETKMQFAAPAPRKSVNRATENARNAVLDSVMQLFLLACSGIAAFAGYRIVLHKSKVKTVKIDPIAERVRSIANQ